MNEVTHIMSAIGQGDPVAVAHLLPLVYDELGNKTQRSLIPLISDQFSMNCSPHRS